ncbi:hypothetical protein HOP50_16g76540 [Chloropicon primus]|uniref:Pre-rRNA-processing protein TSR2 n=1 Tax=Chloropicon primus TaxID=1764295 RepID=A0A5B8MWB2_9CHLO|nr:hypothetical protein A3770_16p76260 [Chloropicon primus]UPR04317.1 hypothetical protein HOP50_16g76540 [Chloropicon primus]|eukprot:QDZ25108.1 hypothetical protein A3770_16p76260 [Chloropicon primus]
MELRSGYALGMRDAQRPELTPQHVEQLRKGVILVFTRWTALQLAIANQWGGQDSEEKARVLVDKVVCWLTETKEVYADELEDLLDNELIDDWNTQAEDESPGQVAGLVTRVFWETARNEGTLVQELEGAQTEEMRRLGAVLDRSVQEQLWQERERAREERERRREEEKRERREDDDGWTTVTR